ALANKNARILWAVSKRTVIPS
ncbi:MAG: hypothetical protein RLZZ373_2981, partial [Pseudomonadota bacterium]